MSIRLDKPFQDLTPENLESVQGQLGVYQLADENDNVFYIGYAGGRSLFGLRGELSREMETCENKPTRFRYEINQQYISRYEELLMLHKFDYGELPERVKNEYPYKVGVLSPN